MAAASIPTSYSRALAARAQRLGQSSVELTRYQGSVEAI